MDRIVESMFNKVRRVEELLSNGKVLNEITLSRVHQHVSEGMTFVMISLSRYDMPDKMKSKAYAYLKDKVREKGYGFVELRGGYIEKGDGDESDKEVVDEKSLMVTLPKNSTESEKYKFLKDFIQIGKIDYSKDVAGGETYGPQDSILYCNGDNFLGYIITGNGSGKSKKFKFDSKEITVEVDMEFKYKKGSTDSLPMAIEKYFSTLAKGSHKGKKFAFQPKDDSDDNKDNDKKVNENFFLYEMWDRRYPKHPDKDWWYNFGQRVM